MSKKIKLILSSILFILALSLITLPALAGDKLNSSFSILKNKVEENKKYDKVKVLKVGDEYITKKEIEDFRAFKINQQEISNQRSVNISDRELIKELVTERLLLQKAREKNVEATIAEGKIHAMKMKEILSFQPKEAQEFQNLVIEMSGLSEDEYWNDYAPKMYQELLSTQNLIERLIAEGVLPLQEDPNNFGQSLRRYREELFQSSLDKVEILDSSLKLQ